MSSGTPDAGCAAKPGAAALRHIGLAPTRFRIQQFQTPNVLYATGFESSVWKAVNRGESWIRLNGYNFKWGQRVFPDPVNAKMIYVCTYGGCIWHGPADGDPDAMEDIVTPIMRPGR